MTLKRNLDARTVLPPAMRPARWRSYHTAAALVTLIVGGLVVLFPANAAAAAGQIVIDEENALYMRAGITGFALWVALIVRGRPWWDVLVCLLIAAFASGQMLRAMYTPEVSGIPTALMWANLASLIYLFGLAWRPSVYERLAESEAENKRLRGEKYEPHQ